MYQRALEASDGIAERFKLLLIAHAEQFARQNAEPPAEPHVTEAEIRSAFSRIVASESFDILGTWRAWTGDAHPFNESQLSAQLVQASIKHPDSPGVTNMSIDDDGAVPLLECIRYHIGEELRRRLKNYKSRGKHPDGNGITEKDVQTVVGLASTCLANLQDETKKLLQKALKSADKELADEPSQKGHAHRGSSRGIK